jgi:type VI secretion system secreted protein VgrG
MAMTQRNRRIEVTTPLGPDVLLLRGFTITEQLGRPFLMSLDLLSQDHKVQFDDLVGQNVTVRLSTRRGAKRHFNGFISRFRQVQGASRMAQYQAQVMPWLWFLTRTADCRIFQNLTVPEIIKSIFRERGFSGFDDRLTGTYRPREYCVQYRETDFRFVSRLMEQEGIYYFFLHQADQHMLVLADSPACHADVPGYEKVAYRPTVDWAEDEVIQEWSAEQEVQPGTYVHDDFDFSNPRKALQSKCRMMQQHAHAALEVYDYPGDYTDFGDGEAHARVRLEGFHARRNVMSGQTSAMGMAAGHTFELTGSPRPEQNGKYLLTGTTVSARSNEFSSDGGAGGAGGGGDGEMDFACGILAMEATQPFRLPLVSPKPVIHGPQTAVVVGKQGEEVWTDSYGRVKVQFHWDRYGGADENSSCWIRVAQVWAGKKWGAMFIPRIGQEVIVEFLEGDPDRPIITGRVYNGVEMPPYDPPAHPTMSTIKSNSSKGGGGFNEIRFEDQKGSEQLFMHAEKNWDVRVKNSAFEWIGADRHLIVKRDQFEHVENNLHDKVDADHVEEVGKDHHLKIVGKQAVDVGGSHSFTVSGDVMEVFKAKHSEQVADAYYLKGMNVVIEAMSNITLKVGGNWVVIDSTGVAINGTMVMLNSGGAPGSGAAGSAVPPAAVTAALPADKADPGQVDEAKKAAASAPPKTPFKPQPAKTSWIEIELVDESGAPVPGAAYQVVLPDGSTAEGTLDEKGLARIDGIDPGNCQITFPDLDQDAWVRI